MATKETRDFGHTQANRHNHSKRFDERRHQVFYPKASMNQACFYSRERGEAGATDGITADKGAFKSDLVRLGGLNECN